MNVKKYENVDEIAGAVIPNSITIKKRSDSYVLESLDNVTDMKSKINIKSIGKSTIYKDVDKEEEISDNEDSNDNESCSDLSSVSDESEITNVTTRSLSTEFSSFSLHEKDMLEPRRKSEGSVMNSFYKNNLQFYSPGKKQCESKRANKTFTIEELMKIERENHILMNKILNIKTLQNKRKPQYIKTKHSSAINRKRVQKQIEEDNMILLKKIQHAKPHVILH